MIFILRRSSLPWLYYGEEPGLAIRVLQNEPVPIRFSFRGKNKVGEEPISQRHTLNTLENNLKMI